MSRPSSSPGSSASSARALSVAPVAARRSLPGTGARLGRPEVGEDVGDGLADRLRVDAVLVVVGLLEPAAAVGLARWPAASSR